MRNHTFFHAEPGDNGKEKLPFRRQKPQRRTWLQTSSHLPWPAIKTLYADLKIRIESWEFFKCLNIFLLVKSAWRKLYSDCRFSVWASNSLFLYSTKLKKHWKLKRLLCSVFVFLQFCYFPSSFIWIATLSFYFQMLCVGRLFDSRTQWVVV